MNRFFPVKSAPGTMCVKASRRRSVHALQFLHHCVHERSQGLLREVEADSGGGEEVGEGAGAAEFQGGAVVGQRCSGVLAGFEPELHSAKLRDAVFDVVEGDVEEVELALPGGGSGVFVAGPVDFAAEAVQESEPVGGPGLLGGVWGGVEPVLEGIDDGDPGEDADDAFDEVSLGAVSVGGLGIEDVEVIGAQQFHGHAGDFAEFQGGVSEKEEGLIAGGEGVEGVAGLVEEHFDISLQSGGVHEDEGLSDFFETGLIAAGLFAASAGEVEVFVCAQRFEIIAELGVHAGENVGSLADELIDLGFGERPKRGLIVRINREIPGAQAVEIEIGGTLAIELVNDGDASLGDGIGETEAIVGFVVESLEPFPHVIAVILAAGVLRDFLAECEELIEDGVDGGAVGEAAVGAGFPGFLACGAVLFFVIAGELLERLLLAAEVDGHGAGDFVVFVDELGDFDIDPHILLAKNVDFRLPFSGQHLVTVAVQGRAMRGGEEFFLEGKAQGFELGFDVLGVEEKGFLDGGVFRVTAFVDVAANAEFFDDAAEFGDVGEPFFQSGGGFDGAIK